jgi:predicted nucleic acid-binding protein
LALKRWLVDTGPFVAYLDRTDPMHALAAARLDNFVGQLVTTSAVITETMYFVGDAPEGPTSLAHLLVGADVHIGDMSQPADVLAAALLMKKYHDTPMDFADATLVLLAEQLGLTEVATLDRRGFSTYRIGKGKRFQLVLDD